MAPPVTPPKILTGEEIDAFITQLHSDSTDMRIAAFNRFGQFGRAHRCPWSLPDVLLSLTAIRMPILLFGPGAVGILMISFNSRLKYAKPLFAALDDPSEEVRGLVESYLFLLPRDQSLVSECLAVLNHSNAALRRKFIGWLSLGPFDTAITQQIIALLSDQDCGCRNEAISALSSIYSQSQEQAVIAKPVPNWCLERP